MLFVTNHLVNRHKGKSLSFYRDSYIVKNKDTPDELINTYCSGLLSSYHLNTIGEADSGIPFVPGELEDKPAYRVRVA